MGVGHVGWKKVKGFFLLRKIRSTGRRPPPSAEALAPTNLPREASNSSKTPRRSPDEAFFPIPSALFENAIAPPASLLPTFYVLSYPTLRRKNYLLDGTKYVQPRIKSTKLVIQLMRYILSIKTS